MAKIFDLGLEALLSVVYVQSNPALRRLLQLSPGLLMLLDLKVEALLKLFDELHLVLYY